MSRKMLIDATHAEETRVAVVDGTRLVEYDYESKVRKQLKGSIFLAKVTRVEPSLQAAFVNFGGNRHGFLPFSEIHPDYFRIPIADREALLAEQRAEMEARQREEDEEDEEEEAAASETGVEEEDEEEDEVEEIGGADTVAVDEDEDEAGNKTAVQATEVAAPVTIDEPAFAAPVAADTRGDEPPAPVEDEHAPLLMAEGDDGHDHHDEAGDDAASDNAEAGATAGEDGNEGGNESDSEGDNQDDNRRGRRGGRNRGRARGRNRGGRNGGGRRAASDSRRVEVLGGEGAEGDHAPRPSLRRNYKIQEVVKRGQIMLIQVSKEERGNKGAAVTTYLSLPGRYCVLMPNSPRGGGVSRKIASFQERRRMRELLSDLEVPEGMSVIMRTAGVSRTKVEIKRDLDYLTRLWDGIRELTLQSTAPSLVHEEGNLIRRAIRDIYTRDIDDVIVAGDDGYKIARDFMKMMIPSHVKRVNLYKDEGLSLFQRYQVENQVNSMAEPVVTLRSGGYLVINQTEALVAVDVNSGRATKERHIEETALKTNLEAADEVARQLRLRDLGGLVIVDFIDMEDRRNNRKVEQRFRDALSTDRARIQIGRISSFGLLELSRQRLNPSLNEAQFEKCPHCKGQGTIRTVDSAAIMVLRALQEEAYRTKSAEMHLHIATPVAIYILNHKRETVVDIETKFGLKVLVRIDDELAPAGYRIDAVRGPAVDRDDDEEDERPQPQQPQREARQPAQNNNAPAAGEEEGEGDEGGKRRRRGRRGGRRRRGRDRDGEGSANAQDGESRSPRDSNDDEDGSKENFNVRDDDDEDAEDDVNYNVEGAHEQRSVFDGDENGNGGKRRGRRGGRGREGGGNGGNAAGNGGRRESGKSDNFGNERAAHNDDQPVIETHMTAVREEAPAPKAARAVNEAAEPKPYEQVNEAPSQKKKGWWNRLVD